MTSLRLKFMMSLVKVDLVTASNVFAHSDKLQEITNNVFGILKKGGTFINRSSIFSGYNIDTDL